MIHPMIDHLYPELDLRQLEVVGHRDGALRVIAGPGAGKTLVMCLLGVNLLLLGAVSPEQLVLCTFGKPAAAKLRQRFRSAATAAGYGGDLDRVRIATIHSICRRILGPAPTLLDKWQQLDLLATHFHRIFGPDQAALGRWLRRDGDWDLDQAAKHFDRIVDELIRPQDLIDSGIPFLAAVGRCYRRYEATLRDEDLVDFAHLQAWVYDLLLDDRIADPSQPASAICWLTNTRTRPTSRNASCCAWRGRTATFAWWATMTRGSTVFGAPACGICWSFPSIFSIAAPWN